MRQMSLRCMLQVPQVDFENSSLRSKGLWIAITLALWLGTTWVFWVGYAGCDDLFYVALCVPVRQAADQLVGVPHPGDPRDPGELPGVRAIGDRRLPPEPPRVVSDPGVGGLVRGLAPEVELADAGLGDPGVRDSPRGRSQVHPGGRVPSRRGFSRRRYGAHAEGGGSDAVPGGAAPRDQLPHPRGFVLLRGDDLSGGAGVRLAAILGPCPRVCRGLGLCFPRRMPGVSGPPRRSSRPIQDGGILAGLHDRRLRPRYDGGPRGDRRVGLFRLAYQQSVLLQALWL